MSNAHLQADGALAALHAPPQSLPAPHRQFLQQCLARLQADARVQAVWAGGSYSTDQMDDYSDIDLLIVSDAAQFTSLRADGQHLAAACGELLAAFSGEHVGQPDLLICLFDVPLLHVDLKFVRATDAMLPGYTRLWSRTAAVSADALPVPGGAPDLDRIEARFWIWVHYGAAKIGRGELLEAVDFLAFVRMVVLGPLALSMHDAPPFGVRRVETALAPAWLDDLVATVPRYDLRDCARALRQAAQLYRRLREARAGALFGNARAEAAAMAYLAAVTDALA